MQRSLSSNPFALSAILWIFIVRFPFLEERWEAYNEISQLPRRFKRFIWIIIQATVNAFETSGFKVETSQRTNAVDLSLHFIQYTLSLPAALTHFLVVKSFHTGIFLLLCRVYFMKNTRATVKNHEHFAIIDFRWERKTQAGIKYKKFQIIIFKNAWNWFFQKLEPLFSSHKYEVFR